MIPTSTPAEEEEEQPSELVTLTLDMDYPPDQQAVDTFKQDLVSGLQV
jgi:hypothetical protein